MSLSGRALPMSGGSRGIGLSIAVAGKILRRELVRGTTE